MNSWRKRLAKGAAAALVSHVPEGVAADAPLLIVPDVLQALEALGRAARARTTRPRDRGDRIGRQNLDQGNAARGFWAGRAASTPPRPAITTIGACR